MQRSACHRGLCWGQNLIRLTLTVSLLIALVGDVWCQHPWQTSPQRDLATVAEILGPVDDKVPTRDVKIVWVWGDDENHKPGYHEYGKVKDKFARLFRMVPRVTFEEAKGFPTPEQWQTADLVVFYLQLESLKEHDFEQMDSYLRRGGGMVAIHAAMVLPGQELANRFGLAWKSDASRWGVLPDATIDPATPLGIMKGFPEKLSLVDEHYWNLLGSVDDITVLATAPGGPQGASKEPADPSQLDGKAWPLFWTKEVSRGRVFGSIPGHNLFTFDDPYFRIILLRGMAWAMRQPVDPFKPLVTAGNGNQS